MIYAESCIYGIMNGFIILNSHIAICTKMQQNQIVEWRRAKVMVKAISEK
jgi:hypothetical protein